MKGRGGPVLAVFAAVLVVVGGIVIVSVATQDGQTGVVAIATRSTTSSVRQTSSPRARTTPKPLPATLTGCHPDHGPDQLADVSADRVNRAWTRIENWLATHAPATRLEPPADRPGIVAAQKKVGVAFPAELVASLLRHDGAGRSAGVAFTFPPYYQVISVDQIAYEARMMCDVLTGLDEPGSVSSWWHGQYVPFAVDNSGDSLFLDQRPGKGGRLGEHDNEGDVNFDRWPTNLTGLLELTADALETGRTVLGFVRAHVNPDGVLEWEIIR
jgi:cell wall assembly regulator SMI1